VPQVIDAATGQARDATAEEAQAGFQAGKLQLPKDAPVHMVTPGGQVRQVDPTQAQQVVQAGGRFAKDEEVHAAQLEAKYGGLGGAAAAGAEGLARGVSFGISDPLAVEGTRLFGGDEAAEKVRTHLREEKEAHPWLATGAELTGAIAPTLFTGGAGGAVEGGEALATLGRIGGEEGALARVADGIKTLGAIPRGVNALGEGAEHLAAAALGDTAESVLGRAAQAAAKQAANGIVQGGLFGAGDQISDATLQNVPLVSEKTLANVGLSALLGGFGSGVLAFGGKLAAEGAGSVMEHLAPKLDEAAGEQAWKWLDPGKKLSEEAEARAGGTDAVGRTVYEEVLKPAVEKEGIGAAAMDLERKGELIDEALQRKGKEIADLVASKPDATVSLGQMLDPIEARIQEFRGKVGGDDKVAALEKLRGSVLRVLGQEPDYAAMRAAVREEIGGGAGRVHAPAVDGGAVSRHLEALGGDYQYREVPIADITHNTETWSEGKLKTLRDHMDAGNPIEPVHLSATDKGAIGVGDGIHRISVARELGYTHIPAIVDRRTAGALDSSMLRSAGRGAEEGAQAIDERMAEMMSEHVAEQGEKAIPIADAIRQRRALQQIAFEESKALDPQLRVQLFRDVTREWNTLEEEALNKASEGDSGLLGTRLRELNKTYQQLKLAERAVETSTARYATNRNLSLTDYLMGAAHAPAMLLTGNVLGAAGAMASSFGHRALRKHGNAFAALMLERLATYGGVSRAVAEHDAQMQRAVTRLLAGGEAREVTTPRKPSGARFEKAHAQVLQLSQAKAGAIGEHLDQQLQPLAMQAPRIAQGVTAQSKRAIAFLVSKLPPGADTSMTLTPNAPQPAIPPAQRAQFMRYYDAVEEGPAAILKDIASGHVSDEAVEVLQNVYPESFVEAKQMIATAAAGRKKPLGQQQNIRIWKLFDLPTDPTLAPGFIQTVQQSYVVAPQGAGQPGGTPKRGSAPAHIGVSKTTAGPFERAAATE